MKHQGYNEILMLGFFYNDSLSDNYWIIPYESYTLLLYYCYFFNQGIIVWYYYLRILNMNLSNNFFDQSTTY